MTAREVLEAQPEVVNELVAVYKNGERPIPWFGAGASLDYGFPAWRSFLLKAPVSQAQRKKIEILLAKNRYEQAADYVYESMGRSAFEDYFAKAFAIEPSVITSSTLLTEGLRLANNFVVTTNYDRVLPQEIEARFGYAPNGFDVVHPGITNASRANDFSFWRMHGDCDNTYHRVLRSAEYDNRYGKKRWVDQFRKPVHTPLEEILNVLFGQRFLFMGCSLAADRTMDAMYKWAKTVPSSSASFAFLEEFDPADMVSRSKFLSDRNIKPILFPRGAYGLLPEMVKIIADDVEHLLDRPYLSKVVGLSIQSRISSGEPPRTSTANKPHLDLCPHFEGQKLHPAKTWNDIATEIDSFLTINAQNGTVNIDLNAHLSLAYFVGTRFPDTSAVRPVFLQKLGKKTETWSSNDGRHGPIWTIDLVDVGVGEEFAIVVDTKVRGAGEAIAYLKGISSVGKVLVVSPPSNSDGFISGGSHASAIGDELIARAKEFIPAESYGSPKHLILAGPAGLAFALGQKAMNLGPVILHEHVRDNAISSYVPSFTCSR